MLGDRRYMNTSSSSPEEGRKMLYVLIGINIFAFLFLRENSELYRSLSLSAAGIKNGRFYELITAMFLHSGFGHIFFNMWSLYIFGSIVAPILGKNKFLWLYFISGIVGNLMWLAANWNGSPYYVVGASGAVFGVMLAVAMLTPNVQFAMIFFPVPIKARTLVIVFALIEILGEVGRTDNIAHLAHLGGFVGAYIYLKVVIDQNLRWDFFSFMRHKQRPGENANEPKIWRSPNLPVSQKELDGLLDKVSRSGINSLTGDEMKRLRQAREQMRK